MPLNEGAVNEIQPFAPEGLENAGDLMPLAEYSAHPMRRRGHMPGLALRELQNRASRQAGHMAAGLAQFIANRYPQGVKDDADLDKIEEGLSWAIASLVNISIENSGGAGNQTPVDGQNPYLGYPGEFRDFFELAPPPGWAARNGALLAGADTVCPELWAHLLKMENAWKCKTLTEWNALSAAAGGVGGVPYFVLDTASRIIKLPDTRGDYLRAAGSKYLQEVGAWHADQFQGHRHNNGTPSDVGGSGGDLQYFPGQAVRNPVYFNDGYNAGGCGTPRVGTETRVRAFGVLGCVYMGGV